MQNQNSQNPNNNSVIPVPRSSGLSAVVSTKVEAVGKGGKTGTRIPVVPFVLLLTIFILGVGIFLGRTYFITKQNSSAGQNTPISIVSAPTKEAAPGTDIANWKTYTNKKYRFEIKYPDDYFKLAESSSDGLYLAPFQGEGGTGPKFLKAEDVWVNIVATVLQDSRSSIDDYLNSSSQKSFYQDSTKSVVVINGEMGSKITYDYPAVAGNATTFNVEGLFLKDGNLHKITMSSWNKNTLESKKTIFDQILSTFKFTEPAK
jgi:hypothetical protein